MKNVPVESLPEVLRIGNLLACLMITVASLGRAHPSGTEASCCVSLVRESMLLEL